ncbi:MAG: hypothetical protein RR382_00625 [Tannerellaceae bacterium]
MNTLQTYTEEDLKLLKEKVTESRRNLTTRVIDSAAMVFLSCFTFTLSTVLWILIPAQLLIVLATIRHMCRTYRYGKTYSNDKREYVVAKAISERHAL